MSLWWTRLFLVSWPHRETAVTISLLGQLNARRATRVTARWRFRLVSQQPSWLGHLNERYQYSPPLVPLSQVSDMPNRKNPEPFQHRTFRQVYYRSADDSAPCRKFFRWRKSEPDIWKYESRLQIMRLKDHLELTDLINQTKKLKKAQGQEAWAEKWVVNTAVAFPAIYDRDPNNTCWHCKQRTTGLTARDCLKNSALNAERTASYSKNATLGWETP